MKKAAQKLVEWYRARKVPYPWRTTSDPYRIWVSEILLQQTRISVALPFYERIVRRFPSFRELAAAEPAEFLAAWSGIGYYRRAENMLACAKRVVRDHGGRFPRSVEALQDLPGIGAYTAGAIRNLCFGELTPAIDGNINRVLARMTGCRDSVKSSEFKSRIGGAFMELGAGSPAGDFFQSLMELGERVCLPQPECPQCPVRKHCSAWKEDATQVIPSRLPRKATQPVFWYFLMIRRGLALYFVQNERRDFLKTAWLFPDLLSKRPLSSLEIQHGFLKRWGIKTRAIEEQGTIRHTVTFRKITGHVLESDRFEMESGGGLWLTPRQLRGCHTSSVIWKILKL